MESKTQMSYYSSNAFGIGTSRSGGGTPCRCRDEDMMMCVLSACAPRHTHHILILTSHGTSMYTLVLLDVKLVPQGNICTSRSS